MSNILCPLVSLLSNDVTEIFFISHLSLRRDKSVSIKSNLMLIRTNDDTGKRYSINEICVSPCKFSIMLPSASSKRSIFYLRCLYGIRVQTPRKDTSASMWAQPCNQEIRCCVLIGVYGTRGCYASAGIIHRLCNELLETIAAASLRTTLAVLNLMLRLLMLLKPRRGPGFSATGIKYRS